MERYDEALAKLIVLVGAFATAVNLPWRNKRVIIKTPFMVPYQFKKLIDVFNDSQNYSYITFEKYDDVEFNVSINETNPVVLLSGGKDSAYLLYKLLKEYSPEEITPIYVRGSAINAEFLDELKAIKKITDRLKVNFKEIPVYVGNIFIFGLAKARRTIWRDLLLLAIARQFSKNIYIGETYDPIFHSYENMIENVKYYIPNFSATRFAFKTIEDLTQAKITINDYELEVYRVMKTELRDLFELTRSCFDPLRKCDPVNDWEHSCRKCKTFHIYDKLLSGEPFTPEELKFIFSRQWLGPTDIPNKIRAQLENENKK